MGMYMLPAGPGLQLFSLGTQVAALFSLQLPFPTLTIGLPHADGWQLGRAPESNRILSINTVNEFIDLVNNKHCNGVLVKMKTNSSSCMCT